MLIVEVLSLVCQPLLRRVRINRRQSVVVDAFFGKANANRSTPKAPWTLSRRQFGNNDCKAIARCSDIQTGQSHIGGYRLTHQATTCGTAMMKDWIISIMQTMGYTGIGLLMFLENLFPPIPSELIMPAAGFAATSGGLTLWGAILAGIVGSVLGQLPLYYLGRIVGRRRLKRLANRYGRWLMVSADSIDRADASFNRHGKAAVFFCRVVPGLRSLISIPAGIAKMNLATFLLWTTLGTSIWTSALTTLGYVLGRNYERVSEYLGPISTAITVLLVAAVVVWVVRRRRRKATASDTNGSHRHSNATAPAAITDSVAKPSPSRQTAR